MTEKSNPQLELAQFIVSLPTLEQLAHYHLSDEHQSRLDYLVQQPELTSEEQAELKKYRHFQQLLQLLNAKAQAKLDETTPVESTQ